MKRKLRALHRFADCDQWLTVITAFLKVLRVLLISILCGMLIAVLAGGVALIVASRSAHPGTLRAITIYEQGVHIRIGGSKIDCDQERLINTSVACNANILGEPLTVQISRNAVNHFTFSKCLVTYRGEPGFCYPRTYTMTVEPDAVVTGLGLSVEELKSLRIEHILTSRCEQEWRSGAKALASVAASLAVLASAALVTGGWMRRLSFGALAGGGTFALFYLCAIILLLSAQVVD